MIPFNKPHLSGKEFEYIEEAIKSGKISGNGNFTAKCQSFFQNTYKFKKCLLTSSCTDALEMAAILVNIQPGDEVIIPTYTFVSTANAFVLRGAKIVFADSCEGNPNINAETLEQLITPKTRAIVVVHYAGVACDMEAIMRLADRHKLFVVEDAAHAIDSFFQGKALGGIGHLGVFSFHETKNIISGEGGMLIINDDSLIERAEIIWEKGTNRAAFFRGDVRKYEWVDIGSSFLPSEITAAFLFAQLENISAIQQKRICIWNAYYERLSPLAEKGYIALPQIPAYASRNGHLFYLLLSSMDKRNSLLSFLTDRGVHAVFHYLPLHSSPFYREKHDGRLLQNAEKFSGRLLRLPLFYELEYSQIHEICDAIYVFADRNP